MRLKTYRIDQKNPNVAEKIFFFRAISEKTLGRDKFWHFFLDPKGATFRFLPESEGKVRHWLIQHTKSRGIRWKKSTDYEPGKHEYWGVSFLGDDILPLFHELSILALKYPWWVMTKPILERLNHGLVNMTGIHNFGWESEIYLNLAFSRAELGRHIFPLPKWAYKTYLRFASWLKRHETNRLSDRKGK